MVEESIRDTTQNHVKANERTPLLANEHSSMVQQIGISQETLVSESGTGQSVQANKLPQYIAGLSATLGALAAGMVLGWTSPAGEGGIKLQNNYHINISKTEFSWIGSLATLGAGAVCVPIGILTDLIGRKRAMLILIVPFTIGWLCIILADSVLMFYIGRFITGLSGGAFCVTSPMYTAEIAENEIRGRLGSYFQLLLTVGILATYVLGNFVYMFELSIISATVPIIFFCIFIFMPETPVYYLKKGDEAAARASLLKLRGSHYNVEPELSMHKESLEEIRRNRIPFFVAMRSRAAMKGLTITFGLMLFQQLSGVNAIIFYSSTILSQSDLMEANVATVIVGVMQVVAVFVSTMVVDRLGRRILLLISICVMFLCTFVLGVYFYLSEIGEDISGIKWLPLLCVCGFIILFSLGFGPLPWMMIGEIFSSQIKGIAGSSACLFNWLLAFLVTKTYSDLNNVIHESGTFWLFSVICAIGIFFVYFLVPETKGKSLEQIQRELSS